ncbi:MAG: DNA-formamidopyrimidine glycosylase [Thermomicrobiales bacterium]
MPELPEVETVRKSLHNRLLGRTIESVRLYDFMGVLGDEDPDTFAALTIGRHVVDTRRRGKYILVDLDDGSFLLVHLRMTGTLMLVPRDDPPLRFEHLAIGFDHGLSLRFADQRKFGRVLHVLPHASSLLEKKLGPEPFAPAFTAQALAASLTRRTAPIKSVLLDQKTIAGMGNIYADEALYRARIHPLTPANQLSAGEIRRLHRSIREVLREGLGNRGTSISHFRDGAGEAGSNQSNLRVYGKGRTGEPCGRCGRPLAFLVIGGRSSHFCPQCQQLTAALAASQ